jgi:hypothetical protein
VVVSEHVAGRTLCWNASLRAGRRRGRIARPNTSLKWTGVHGKPLAGCPPVAPACGRPRLPFGSETLDSQTEILPVISFEIKWKDIVSISGPAGLRLIKGFHDEALRGKWKGVCREKGYEPSTISMPWMPCPFKRLDWCSLSAKPTHCGDPNLSKGRPSWKRLVGYYSQSKAENVMYRYKKIIGGRLRAKDDEAQEREAAIGCEILNRMREMGRPLSYPLR